eukprot:TRINITY_DN8915_c2_g1_i1.p1 TRINITY_DN8915_c2_g1~~TRINITY_DN8915_c2_g1_i1.p1  ORF type:complete len:272 (+),score=62.48 TRINITY_DN8915_c2_g1_i1:81-818(+)
MAKSDMLWLPFLVCAASVLLGCAVRIWAGYGKWVRALSPSRGQCYVDTGHTDSPVFCLSPPDATHYVNVLSEMLCSLYASLVIPVAEPAVSVAVAALNGRTCDLHKHRRRLVACAVLVVVRMVVFTVKHYTFPILFPETSQCWYSSHRRSGRCSEAWDPSDHIFFVAVQYCGALGLTSACDLTGPRMMRAVWVSTLVVGVALLSLQTALFYHTVPESLAALVCAGLLLAGLQRSLPGLFGAHAAR